MSDLANKILRFNTLDLESYLNETIPRYEHFLLETEKHNVAKIEHEIDTELFKDFLLNSNSLLDILDVYEESYRMVLELVDMSRELTRLRLQDEGDSEVFVDKELVKRFRQILNDFSSDTSVFATEERYLVHFDVVRGDDSEYILVLTNDILIIGKVQVGAKRYRLLNAYNYSIIRVEVDGDVLRIKMEPTTYVFRKDKESVDRILRTYQELTYKYRETGGRTADESDVDRDVAEYLVFTEQYGHMEMQGSHCPQKTMFHDREEMSRYLGAVARLGEDISPPVYSFLERRFEAGLSRINRIQVLDDLIDDVFGYFIRFFHEQDRLVAELSRMGEIRRSGLVLLVEQELRGCLRVLENRIFNREFEVRCMESSLEMVREKLKFEGCDFSYLMDHFLSRRDMYRERCLESAMRDIERILRDMVGQ